MVSWLSASEGLKLGYAEYSSVTKMEPLQKYYKKYKPLIFTFIKTCYTV